MCNSRMSLDSDFFIAFMQINFIICNQIIIFFLMSFDGNFFLVLPLCTVGSKWSDTSLDPVHWWSIVYWAALFLLVWLLENFLFPYLVL